MKKILFIDDESVLQKTFGDIIKEQGYDMVSALDGEIGFRLAKTEKPDLIMLDLVMPKQNGFETLKALKEDEDTQNIPVIVLTNLEDMKNVEKAIELGATTYLVKANYKLEEVVDKIKEALNE